MNAILCTICVTVSIFSILCGAYSSDEPTLAEVLRRVEILEERETHQQSEINKLQKENIHLVNEVQQLREKYSNQCVPSTEGSNRQTQDLRNANVSKGFGNPRVVSDGFDRVSIAETKTKEHGIQGPLKVTDNSRNIRQNALSPPIAFYAIANSYAEHLGQNQPVVFDHVVTNIGQAYHPYIGVFTAPLSGIYVFSSTLLLFQETADFFISVNGQGYGHMYGYSTEKYETSSISSIFELSVGDDVAIRSGNPDKLVHGLNFSSFSGFYLSPSQEGSAASIVG